MNHPRQTDGNLPPLPVEAAYDLSAPFYDNWSWQSFWRTHEAPAVRELLERVSRGRGYSLNFLDVGCGTGWYLDHLLDLCSEQVGVDLSTGMLTVARHRLGRTILRKADARKLPFSDGRFDAVLCTRVLSHIPSIVSAVTEMRRVLVGGGTIIISNVDASHDYELTRLPLAAGHIYAETFKHPRADLFETMENLGFVPGTAFQIHLDGRVEKILRRNRSISHVPIAAWIASWRKSTAKLPDDVTRS